MTLTVNIKTVLIPVPVSHNARSNAAHCYVLLRNKQRRVEVSKRNYLEAGREGLLQLLGLLLVRDLKGVQEPGAADLHDKSCIQSSTVLASG